MGTGGDTRFTFSADDTSFQSAAARTKTTFDRMAGAATTAGGGIDGAFGRAASGATTLGGGLDKAGRAAVKLRGGLAMLSPEAALVAGAVDDAADAVEALGIAGPVVGAALAALAGIIAPIAGHFVVMAREAKEAEARLGLLRDISKDLAVADEALTGAGARAAVAAGRMDETTASLWATEDAAAKMTAEYADKIALATEEQLKLIEASDTLAKRTLKAIPRGIGVAIDYYMGWTSAADEARWAIGELGEAQEEHAVIVGETSLVTQQAIKDEVAKKLAVEAERKATERATREAKDLADATAQMAKIRSDEIARIHALDAALDGFAAAARDARESNLEGVEAEVAAGERIVESIEAERDSKLALARTDGERLEITDAAGEAIAASEEATAERVIVLREELAAAQAEIGKQTLADEQDAADEAVRIHEEKAAEIQEQYQATGDAISSILDSVAGGFELAAEKMAETNKKEARKMFAASQAVAVAQATINIAQGVTAALTIPGPAGWASAIAVAAAGALEIATIVTTEPSFHRGGVFSPTPALLPDEGRAVLRAGEGVLTPETTRRMGGPNGISMLNRTQGMGMGGGGSFRIGRAEVKEMGRIDVRSGGAQSQYARATARRNPFGAGRSGRPPLA